MLGNGAFILDILLRDILLHVIRPKFRFILWDHYLRSVCLFVKALLSYTAGKFISISHLRVSVFVIIRFSVVRQFQGFTVPFLSVSCIFELCGVCLAVYLPSSSSPIQSNSFHHGASFAVFSWYTSRNYCSKQWFSSQHMSDPAPLFSSDGVDQSLLFSHHL